MKKLSLTIISVLILTLVFLNSPVPAEAVPTISIVGVTENDRVTIQTIGFPANLDFDVRMGDFTTLGVGAKVIDKIKTSTAASEVFTFKIPSEMRTNEKIAIRLDSSTHGYYAFNWFFNTNYGSHDEDFLKELLAQSEKPSPIIQVVTVKKDAFITLEGSRFPVGEDFEVLMGKFDTLGVNGIKIGTFTAKADGTIIKDFAIPENLKSESRIAVRVESTESDLFAYTWFANESGAVGGVVTTTPYSGIPTISIVSVNADETVTVRTHNFPANRAFLVLMGKIGTRGVGGTQVTTIASGAGGSFNETFTIPAGLKGSYQIAIRLQTSDGVFYAYNWFYNNTAVTQPVTGSPTGSNSGIPTFSITSVARDNTVTIKTNNFPANYEFKVLMGKMGTKGIGGTQVTTINSGTGGAFTATFDVPSALAGQNQIAIRLESTTGGFYAFNWFYNNTYP
jgi:hypothetical protein